MIFLEMVFAAAESRLLHYVVRTGNLKKSLDFYENVLGMHVLRHEEFKAACEAQW